MIDRRHIGIPLLLEMAIFSKQSPCCGSLLHPLQLVISLAQPGWGEFTSGNGAAAYEGKRATIAGAHSNGRATGHHTGTATVPPGDGLIFDAAETLMPSVYESKLWLTGATGETPADAPGIQ